jgi:hypothetical protein
MHLYRCGVQVMVETFASEPSTAFSTDARGYSLLEGNIDLGYRDECGGRGTHPALPLSRQPGRLPRRLLLLCLSPERICLHLHAWARRKAFQNQRTIRATSAG